MVILKFSKSEFVNKKGRSFLLLPFFLFVISCTSDLSNYGRVTLQHSSTSNNLFVFSVSDEFTKSSLNSAKSETHPKMTEVEEKLLIKLLKQKKYCIGTNGLPFFSITSRQEKIYDMTFAHLIEQNYNAKAVAPRMYFGRCVKE